MGLEYRTQSRMIPGFYPDCPQIQHLRKTSVSRKDYPKHDIGADFTYFHLVIYSFP